MTSPRCRPVCWSRRLSGGRFPLLQKAEEIALTHHKHWDGHGYMGISGDAIPLAGRIVTVADVFDALAHKRVYKTAWSLDEAVAEIRAQSGRQFDPRWWWPLMRCLLAAPG